MFSFVFVSLSSPSMLPPTDSLSPSRHFCRAPLSASSWRFAPRTPWSSDCRPVRGSFPGPGISSSFRLVHLPATVVGLFLALVLWQAGLTGIRRKEASHPPTEFPPLPSSQDRDLMDTVVTSGNSFLSGNPRPLTLAPRPFLDLLLQFSRQPLCLWSSGRPSIFLHLLILKPYPRRPPHLLSRTHVPPP